MTSVFSLFLMACCFLSGVSVLAAPVTKAQRDEVGKELACLCDTCPRRPLDECTCGYAQQQQARIEALLGEGKTGQQVIDIYVAEFGMRVLSKPPAEGFNLTAWLMPPLVLLFGFVVVRSVLRTWSHSKPVALAGGPKPDAASDPYLERLEQELRERES
ncbi:MAG: cytochrome c-type biogenesis protein CcmH [bacterium]|jgi:cytochrome c-type biogenesis protein CcmH/NrfF|nr:cytochrome c-type biogenesis protein CcmH [bacterium]